ncbi:MAG: gamma-glutamyl-gamma-aminobutyrate hydrolase family protein [Mycobacterium sp.]
MTTMHNRKPRIGLTGRRFKAETAGLPQGFWDAGVDAYMTEYADSIVKAGGTPLHLPLGVDPADILEVVDGLVFVGGADVDPRLYGSAPGPMSSFLEPVRDQFEVALLRRALDFDMPILGICRGAQLINVVLGGTLVAHLPVGEGESHSSYAYPRAHRTHMVNFEPNSLAEQLYGPSARVNSFHHQAVLEPGRGVVVTGRAADGVVECYEVADRPVVGVQWHPEVFLDDPIFHWLVSASASASASDQHDNMKEGAA